MYSRLMIRTPRVLFGLLRVQLRPPPRPRSPSCPLETKEHLYLLVDNCTLDMQRGQDTASKLADLINGYPNATM